MFLDVLKNRSHPELEDVCGILDLVRCSRQVLSSLGKLGAQGPDLRTQVLDLNAHLPLEAHL